MKGVHAGNVKEVFTYHPPDAEQQSAYVEIRHHAEILARVIIENTVACADQQAALRKLREAVMTANAAVALRGQI